MAEALGVIRSPRSVRVVLVVFTLSVAPASVGCGDDGSSAAGTTEAGSVTGTSASSESSAASSSSTTASSSTTDPLTTSGSSTTSPETTTGASEDGGTWQTTSGCGFTCPNPPGAGGAIQCVIGAGDCADGNKCAPWANDGGTIWTATRCVPLDPAPDGAGEPCTYEGAPVSGVDSCDVGLWCGTDSLETNDGTCVALCGGAVPSCAPKELCLTPGTLETVGVCTGACDPLAQDCGPDMGCWPAGLGFGCHYTLPFEPPKSCSTDNQCSAGEICKPADEVLGCDREQCCTPLCNLDDTSCAAGSTCVDYGSPLSAHAKVGYCQG